MDSYMGLLFHSVARNSKGNKVTKTIFTGSRVYYARGLTGDNFSKPEPDLCQGLG
jgi:hypothetical protein